MSRFSWNRGPRAKKGHRKNSFLPLSLVFSKPCKATWLRKYPEAEERGGTGPSHFLPSCPPSLRALAPFVSFLFLCDSSLHVLPPFMSFDEADPVLLYLLGDFLSFVGAVHGASPPPPSLCVLPPFVSSIPLCPPSLCVLPPFVSFLPSCPSSLHIH
jgi:hypothetical protein